MANTRQTNEPGYNSRSVSGGLLRGGLLLLVAVVVGAVLLQQTKENRTLNNATPAAATVTTTTIAAGNGLEVTPTPDPADPSATPAATALPLRAQALVKVLVVNGSGVNRAAARVRASMASTGYNLLQATDATASNLADSVFYNPGFEGEARQIATLLGEIDTVNNILPITTALPIKPPVAVSDVVVIVGPKLQVKYQSQQLGTGTVAGTPIAPASGTAGTVRTGTKKKRTTTTAAAATGRPRTTKKPRTTSTAAATPAVTPAAATPAAATAAEPAPAAETPARVPVGSPAS
jgi:LytR cell envelope-related transcriptional attenuator